MDWSPPEACQPLLRAFLQEQYHEAETHGSTFLKAESKTTLATFAEELAVVSVFSITDSGSHL